jgi:anti-anti-sigma factor
MARDPEASIGIEIWGGGEVAVVALRGEHDVCTAADVAAALDQAAEEARGVVVDLTDAEFVDVRLAGVLADRADELEARGRRLALLVPAEAAAVVHRVLALTDIAACLPIATGRAGAIAAVRMPSTAEAAQSPL